MKLITIDEAFDVIGHLGRGQLVYVIGLASLQFFTCSQMLLNIYQGEEPSSFKCYSKNNTITKPLINSCYDNNPANCRIKYNNNNGFTSFAVEWDLVCSEKYKVALVQSIWMAGVMAGALLLGGAADIFGRLKTLMVALIGTIIFEGFSAFVPTYTMFIALRFGGGVCCSIVILVSFVLSQELIGTTKRSVCGMTMSMFFAVGIAVLSGLAYILDNWRTLGLVTSVSGILFVGLPFYVPESPRWLLGRGDVNEARTVIELIARKNGTLSELPSHWDLISDSRKKESTKKNSARDLVTHPYILILTLIQIFSWFVNSAVYYALTMAASDLGGNIYFSTTLNGLVEIPACLTALFIIDRLGRRIAICGFMLAGGTMCFMIQFVPPIHVNVITTMALCGKLTIAASFSIIYIHSGEIFPTVIRNTGMGIVSVAARIGGILAPFILMLDDVYPSLQFTVLGTMTLIAGVLNLKLPETLGQPMPETVSDILTLGKSRPVSVLKQHPSGYAKLSNKDDDNHLDTFQQDKQQQNTISNNKGANNKKIRSNNLSSLRDMEPLITSSDQE